MIARNVGVGVQPKMATGSNRWILAVLLALSGGIATRLTCWGCVDQTRANRKCELSGDVPLRIDVSNQAQWRHLVSDAQLAEELAVQYADAKFYRWAFPVRNSASGPTQTSDTHADNVHAQEVCLAQLSQSIQTLHAVTGEQVAAARQSRSATFDGLVLASFTPLFILAALSVRDGLSHLLFADAGWVRTASRVWTAVSVSGLGLLAFRLWWTVFEGIRVGNPTGHMGLRMSSLHYWTPLWVVLLFTAAVTIFGGIVLIRTGTGSEAPVHPTGTAPPGAFGGIR